MPTYSYACTQCGHAFGQGGRFGGPAGEQFFRQADRFELLHKIAVKPLVQAIEPLMEPLRLFSSRLCRDCCRGFPRFGFQNRPFGVGDLGLEIAITQASLVFLPSSLGERPCRRPPLADLTLSVAHGLQPE